mmetsp:Transcript_19198/g.3100  ORF Transcript_19198/g.3100 Transcript_19198/m.3100 type:complete len:95 (+) Transcript_19198:98-382(+)
MRAKFEQEGLPSEEPVFTPNLSKFVMLSNLPQAEEAKANTLKMVLGKILTKFECPIEKENITIPIENGKIAGCCFLEFEDEELAKVATSKVDGF